MSLPPELALLIDTIIAKEILALGILAVLAAAILGYLSDRVFGAFILAMLSCIASLICLTGYIVFGLIGYTSVPPSDPIARVAKAEDWATVGLVVAIIVVAGLGVLFGKKMGNSEPGKRRGAIFVSGLWIGCCFASWIGHRAGGWVGLLAITLPAVTVFWLSLYYLARFILPLDEDQSVLTALRCLLTFLAGTNYPYYAMEGREKVERVPGNQFSLFFAGPGIFLTSPDHVVAVSDGLNFKGVRGPGVVFTHLWEVIQEPMDLRPQQRAYPVEAVTKDGILVKVNTFGPFQLDTGKQQPEPGKPFPVRARSVFKAFHERPMEIKRDEHRGEVVEERKRRRWDELYEVVGTRVIQDIIAEYEFNELCEPLDPSKDPRVEIAAKYWTRMEQELSRYGIKVPGGGISNLLPADEDVVPQRRIMNWQAQWQRKMLERLGLAEAEAERLIGQTRAQVQAEMIQSISEALAEVTTDDKEIIINTVALRFIESLNRMIAQPQLRGRLPPGVVRTMDDLPYIIGGGQDV